ncbi:hypothetical protein Pyn_40756 [Prunus yedoensis var. nudiflora]|uniref:Uncharacterized protein n=1 Tax=Prunus yedoensis var. nudiflora TaxID=2094558 RepID=A0A314YJV9_PRUYE|nr:hypothetical protein Pyn_40756 [Prunus yedoensis var. nudiflora]
MPCDEEVNVETETQRLGEISNDGVDSDTLYSYGNTSDDENSNQQVTKNERIHLPKFKQYRRATDLKRTRVSFGDAICKSGALEISNKGVCHCKRQAVEI